MPTPETVRVPVLLQADGDDQPVVWVAVTLDNRFCGVYASEEQARGSELIEGMAVYVSPVVIEADPVVEASDHRFSGLCPDPTQPESRDPDCPACQRLQGAYVPTTRQEQESTDAD